MNGLYTTDTICMPSHKTTFDWRQDKYGQVIKANCSCGIHSNWHTSKERANIGLIQEHEDDYNVSKQ
jgi:hypothetical protein